MKSLPAAIIAAAVLALSLLAACSNNSEAEQLANARQQIDKENYGAAIIQLKSLLQGAPSSAEGRFLLGKALLGNGFAAEASIELQKARELNYPEVQVGPLLAKAWLAVGKHTELVNTFGGKTLPEPRATASLATDVAMAQLRLGNAEQASSELQRALAAMPTFAPALLVQARQQSISGDVDGALVLVERAIAAEAKDADAWQLKGTLLLFGKGDKDGALVAFRRTLEIEPRAARSHESVFDVLLSKGDRAGARKQFEAMRAALPAHPATTYVSARLALQEGRAAEAREIAQNLLRLRADDPKYLFLAATADFELGSLARAEAGLIKLLQIQPKHSSARRLLSLVHLRGGDPKKALEDVRPLLDTPKPTPDILAIAAEAHLQAGDAKTAESLFRRASASDPNDPRLRTSLALTHLAGGDSLAAFDELRAIATTDKGTTADLALISESVRRNEFASALKAIDALEHKLPAKPLTAYIRGRVQLQMRATADARASFNRALSLDPVYFPAVESLGALDIVEGKLEDARNRYQVFLKKESRSAAAYVALADIRVRQNADRTEIIRLLTQAIETDKSAILPRMVLIDQYLRWSDVKQALATAQEANAAIPNRPEILEVLGRAELASGNANQANSTFAQLASQQPRSVRPLLLWASAQTTMKNYEGAAQSFKRALKLAPNLLPAQQGLIALALVQNHPKEAVAIARNVQQQRPKSAVGFLFEGEIEVRSRNWEAAANAFRNGLTKSDPGDLPSRLHQVLLAAKKPAEAEHFVATWLKNHADDKGFIVHLGDSALVNQDYAGAETRFRALWSMDSRNPSYANNLAWSLVRQGKPGAAAIAAKAVELMPTNAQYLDTLAWALAEEGAPDKASQSMKRALELAPNEQTLQLSAARLYIKLGQKELARSELDKVMSNASSTGRVAEAKRLRDGLN